MTNKNHNTVTLDQVRDFVFEFLRKKGDDGATPTELGEALACWLKQRNVDISYGFGTVTEAIIWDPTFRRLTRFDGEKTVFLGEKRPRTRVFFEDELARTMLKRMLREEYWVELQYPSQDGIVLTSKMGDEYFNRPAVFLITCHGIFEPSDLSLIRGFIYAGKFYDHELAMRTGVCMVGKPSAIYWR